MDDIDPKAAAAPTKRLLTMAPLKERASQTAKVIWTGIGALATLGGVVGLVQVFSANNSGGLPRTKRRDCLGPTFRPRRQTNNAISNDFKLPHRDAGWHFAGL